jgi:hypothetical protein
VITDRNTHLGLRQPGEAHQHSVERSMQRPIPAPCEQLSQIQQPVYLGFHAYVHSTSNRPPSSNLGILPRALRSQTLVV